MCAQHAKADNAYSKWGEAFLTYVVSASEATQKYLTKLERSVSEKRYDACSVQLALLTEAWRFLHDFIKPIVDAHILSTPYPLVELISIQVRELPLFKDTKIIVGLSSQLNYLQHPHKRLRELLLQLKRVVDECPPFEDKIGFIYLPYSRSRNVFANCLLYHEVGHLVFKELGLGVTKVKQRLNGCVRKVFKDKIRDITDDDVRWLTFRIVPWIEELFADLFAVRLIGLAFSFAAAELTQLMTRNSPQQVREFGQTHPPQALRLREQLKALSKPGKWTLREPAGIPL